MPISIPMRPVAKKKRGTRDAEASRTAILQAALNEFSSAGYDGARIDRIALEAGVSKPLLYDYFGDKEELYAAALREAYVQIRSGELALDLEALDPAEAIRELCLFTMDHFRTNPWFITMLNTENLRHGATISRLEGRREVQSQLLLKLGRVLERGVAEGRFRDDVEPVRLYVHIASLCYFPVSNRYTLAAVFGVDFDAETLRFHARQAADIVLAWLERKP
jgi:AcrR family transcriptional regulator